MHVLHVVVPLDVILGHHQQSRYTETKQCTGYAIASITPILIIASLAEFGLNVAWVGTLTARTVASVVWRGPSTGSHCDQVTIH